MKLPEKMHQYYPLFGLNDEFMFTKFIVQDQDQLLSVYQYGDDKYIHIMDKDLPQGIDPYSNKLLKDYGRIVLSSVSKLTVVHNAEMTVMTFRNEGALGYLSSKRGDKLVFDKEYSDGWQLDVYSISDGEMLYSLASPGVQWGPWVCSCIHGDGTMVVVEANSRIYFYDDKGKLIIQAMVVSSGMHEDGTKVIVEY